MLRPRGIWLRLLIFNAVFLPLLGVAAWIWGDDVLQALLDPKVPYAIYRPPPAPDYATSRAWALRPPAATRLLCPSDDL